MTPKSGLAALLPVWLLSRLGGWGPQRLIWRPELGCVSVITPCPLLPTSHMPPTPHAPSQHPFILVLRVPPLAPRVPLPWPPPPAVLRSAKAPQAAGTETGGLATERPPLASDPASLQWPFLPSGQQSWSLCLWLGHEAASQPLPPQPPPAQIPRASGGNGGEGC